MLVIAKFGAAFGIKGHIKLNYYSDNFALLKGDLFYTLSIVPKTGKESFLLFLFHVCCC